MQVIGGAPKREALVAGLRNGEVYMIYVDNQFPVLLYSHDVPIRSLDISSTRRKVIRKDNISCQLLTTISIYQYWIFQANQSYLKMRKRKQLHLIQKLRILFVTVMKEPFLLRLLHFLQYQKKFLVSQQDSKALKFSYFKPLIL